MKYIDEFRDEKLAQSLLKLIYKESKKPIRLMEVCGGHTMAIHKYGINTLLPPTIELLSGPGCPVCVTSSIFIDKAIAYSKRPNTIITSYGDLIRVPGTNSSLEKEKANGADIRIIQSILEVLTIVKENPKKTILFLGIGFETTTPSTAIAILEAKKLKLSNLLILSAHKLMPPAMNSLIKDGSIIDGYIAPGHVSTIAGAKIYEPLVKDYNLALAISGFEPIDILQSILMLVRQIEHDKQKIEIQYSRAVSYEGNRKAQQLVNSIFETYTDTWRGIGTISNSGMKLRKEFDLFNAEKQIPIHIIEKPEPKACICGNILKGQSKPTDCKLFRITCTPENPIGACMVSNEGCCAAFYKYSSE